jgi:hypothetical protein
MTSSRTVHTSPEKHSAVSDFWSSAVHLSASVTTSDWIQIGINGALVLVTLIYVLLTLRLSTHAKTANDTSLKILEASEKMKLDGRLPFYLLKMEQWGWLEPDENSSHDDYRMYWRLILLTDQPIRLEYQTAVPNSHCEIDGTRNPTELQFAKADGADHTITFIVELEDSSQNQLVFDAQVTIRDFARTVWDVYQLHASADPSRDTPPPTATGIRHYGFAEASSLNHLSDRWMSTIVHRLGKVN